MTTPVHITKAGVARNQGLTAGLALSLVHGRPVILEGLVDDSLPPRPGLGPGGHTVVQAAGVVSGGRVEADDDWESLVFHPRRVRAGDYSFDVSRNRPSAAPVSLMVEALTLPLARQGQASTLLLAGGTQTPNGVMSDEIAHVLIPNWRTLGLDVSYSEIAPGFLPRGKGEAELQIGAGGRPRPFSADRPFRLREAGVEVVCSGLPAHLAEQALEGALARLEQHGVPAQGRIRLARGSLGMALLVWARSDEVRVGFTALGRRGGRPGALGMEPADGLGAFLATGAAVTGQAAAPLVTAMSCAAGVSRFTMDRLTPSFRSAMRATNAFRPGTVRADQFQPGAPVQVRIQGSAP